MITHGAKKNPIMQAYLKATYQEQVEFRNMFAKTQNVALCKIIQFFHKCLLKHHYSNKEE